MVFISPIVDGFYGIVNDAVVIAFASIASYYVSKAVAKSSVKSIMSSFSVDDVIRIIKHFVITASEDEELKKLLSTFITNAIKSILTNQHLRELMKNAIKEILEDPQIREDAKKVLRDVVEQYPVLAKLLGVSNTKKESERK